MDEYMDFLDRMNLKNAIIEGDIDRIEPLLNKGGDPNGMAHGAPFLVWCANNLAVVRLLVSKGANVNLPDDNNGITPLIAAASKGNTDVVKFLLDNGANIDSLTTLGNTAYSIAIRQRKMETADLLAERGANLNLATFTYPDDEYEYEYENENENEENEEVPPEVVPAAVDGTDPVHSDYNDKSRDNECPVCMETLQPKSATDTVVVIETAQARAAGTKEDPVRCGHKFHRNCLRTLTTCPVCRGPIVRLRPGFPEPMTGGRRHSRGRRQKKTRKQRKTRRKSRSRRA